MAHTTQQVTAASRHGIDHTNDYIYFQTELATLQGDVSGNREF